MAAQTLIGTLINPLVFGSRLQVAFPMTAAQTLMGTLMTDWRASRAAGTAAACAPAKRARAEVANTFMMLRKRK